MRKHTTILRRIDTYIFLWNLLVTGGLLTFLIKYKLDLDDSFVIPADYRDLIKIALLVATKWDVLLLGALLILLVIAVGGDSKKTRLFGEKLFSIGNRPIEWDRVEGRHLFALIVASNISIFLTLAYFLDRASIFTGILTVFFWVGSLYHRVLRRNTRKCLDAYPPLEEDPKNIWILQRREIVEAYLFGRPHLTREVVVSLACAFAMFVGLLPELSDYGLGATPHLILATAVVSNELVLWGWRRRRNWMLDEIDDREVEEEIRSRAKPE